MNDAKYEIIKKEDGRRFLLLSPESTEEMIKSVKVGNDDKEYSIQEKYLKFNDFFEFLNNNIHILKAFNKDFPDYYIIDSAGTEVEPKY